MKTFHLTIVALATLFGQIASADTPTTCKVFAYVKSIGVFAPERLQEIVESKGYALTESTDDADYILEWRITHRTSVVKSSDGRYTDHPTEGRGLYEFHGNLIRVTYRPSVKTPGKYFRQHDVLAPLYGDAWGEAQDHAIARAMKPFPLADARFCGVPETYRPRD